MSFLAFDVFWIGVCVVLYTYLGYGVVIFLLSRIKTQPKAISPQKDEDWPEATMIVAAYNEEGYIEEKIRDTLALDYPPGKLTFFIVTDGSSDRTPDIVGRYPQVKLFHEAARRGKIHAVNRVMKFVRTPIVIFSDANTGLNREAVKNIVRHYQDENVGGVAGEKRILKKNEDNASGSGEGLYWKYESFLKKKDSDVNSVIGAAGELFSLRTNLYEEPAENMLIEDFYISVRITMNGYRFVYEPDAYAIETASASVGEEWKRKVRISAGGFQAMVKLRALLNPFRYGLLSFQYISHRVLRWTLAPLCLPLIFISNAILAVEGLSFYRLTLALQLLFYAVGFAGYLLQDKKISIKGFFVPYYFIVMNLSVFFGFFRFLNNKQSVVWEKAKRAAA